MPMIASCCIGPRVGLEVNDGRAIRKKEWFLLVPVVNYFSLALISLEAYSGKTMTEIAQKENLDNRKNKNKDQDKTISQ